MPPLFFPYKGTNPNNNTSGIFCFYNFTMSWPWNASLTIFRIGVNFITYLIQLESSMKTIPFLHFLPELQVNTSLQQGPRFLPQLKLLEWLQMLFVWLCITFYLVVLLLLPFPDFLFLFHSLANNLQRHSQLNTYGIFISYCNVLLTRYYIKKETS